MERLVRRYRAYRLLIAAVVLIGIPAALSLPAFLDESPIRAGEASPRTVVAPNLIRIVDEEATERARRQAAEAVEPIMQRDDQARIATVEDIRNQFDVVQEIRQAPTAEGAEPPSTEERVDALRDRLAMLDDTGLRLLVTIDAPTFDSLRSETISIVQQLTRQSIRAGQVDDVLDEQLRVEATVRDVPTNLTDAVVEPLIRSAMRPTVVVDHEATDEARRRAAANVDEAMRTFPTGSVIVSAAEEVTPVQLAALERVGLAGSDPRWEVARALAITAIAAAVSALYLRTHRRSVWRSNRKLLLLATLMFGYAAILAGATLVIERTEVWLYAVPSGALGMLATILLGAPVGVLLAVPVTLLTAYVAPGTTGVVAYAAAATLLSVPLVTRLSVRGDLRRAALFATGGYIVLAVTFAVTFEGTDSLLRPALAGAIHGVSGGILVVGGLPFIESAFGLVTATGLIDLADRNHPLLRELEQKALGSYNHSIVVATLVERGCRAVNADPLLGSVMALYHDIGKVRRPYFFIENQFGISNPHDGLGPDISATIIQEHVTDGIKMARSYRLPPEVVQGIATHHGTTVVTYFYLKAVREAAPGQHVDEGVYRYKGRKPTTKETAVLMLADCCEAASRAAAQNDRNLSRDQLSELVDSLFAARIEDGQLDESPLTFQDVAAVRASFLETLCGVYHPRITYPQPQQAEIATEEAPAST
ncbi:MAG: HDIG domain-containing protein [Actinobacteria bacterium]|nr:HDIG domain-containing protein [Actinomycetota bacterium]